MLPRESAIERRFVMPPLLTNVSTLPGVSQQRLERRQSLQQLQNLPLLGQRTVVPAAADDAVPAH